MSPTPEPRPGLYLDSCGTRYLARLDKKTGWWLTKQGRPDAYPAPEPFQRPDFPAAVMAKIFHFSIQQP